MAIDETTGIANEDDAEQAFNDTEGYQKNKNNINKRQNRLTVIKSNMYQYYINKMNKKNESILKYIHIALFFGILFIIIGGACMGSASVVIKQFTQDYTKCEKYFDEDEPDPFRGSCYDYSLTNKSNIVCKCYISIQLPNDFNGEVTLYYTLETFDQSRPEYKNSRDNNQLLGILKTPSEACEPYRLNEGKPILPCGEIADSMFNDTYNLRLADSSEYVPKRKTGLISDKSGFNNPQGNLSEALKNFSKPISWPAEIFQLDTKSPENNGLQNEGFIAWMNTELKRKPAWRVDDTVQQYAQGLHAGNYVLVISYNYPVTRYAGPRILTIEAISSPCMTWDFGVAFLCLGILALVFAAALLYKRYKEETKSTLFRTGR